MTLVLRTTCLVLYYAVGVTLSQADHISWLNDVETYQWSYSVSTAFRRVDDRHVIQTAAIDIPWSSSSDLLLCVKSTASSIVRLATPAIESHEGDACDLNLFAMLTLKEGNSSRVDCVAVDRCLFVSASSGRLQGFYNGTGETVILSVEPVNANININYLANAANITAVRAFNTSFDALSFVRPAEEVASIVAYFFATSKSDPLLTSSWDVTWFSSAGFLAFQVVAINASEALELPGWISIVLDVAAPEWVNVTMALASAGGLISAVAPPAGAPAMMWVATQLPSSPPRASSSSQLSMIAGSCVAGGVVLIVFVVVALRWIPKRKVTSNPEADPLLSTGSTAGSLFPEAVRSVAIISSGTTDSISITQRASWFDRSPHVTARAENCYTYRPDNTIKWYFTDFVKPELVRQYRLTWHHDLEGMPPEWRLRSIKVVGIPVRHAVDGTHLTLLGEVAKPDFLKLIHGLAQLVEFLNARCLWYLRWDVNCVAVDSQGGVTLVDPLFVVPAWKEWKASPAPVRNAEFHARAFNAVGALSVLKELLLSCEIMTPQAEALLRMAVAKTNDIVKYLAFPDASTLWLEMLLRTWEEPPPITNSRSDAIAALRRECDQSSSQSLLLRVAKDVLRDMATAHSFDARSQDSAFPIACVEGAALPTAAFRPPAEYHMKNLAKRYVFANDVEPHFSTISSRELRAGDIAQDVDETRWFVLAVDAVQIVGLRNGVSNRTSAQDIAIILQDRNFISTNWRQHAATLATFVAPVEIKVFDKQVSMVAHVFR